MTLHLVDYLFPRGSIFTASEGLAGICAGEGCRVIKSQKRLFPRSGRKIALPIVFSYCPAPNNATYIKPIRILRVSSPHSFFRRFSPHFRILRGSESFHSLSPFSGLGIRCLHLRPMMMFSPILYEQIQNSS